MFWTKIFENRGFDRVHEHPRTQGAPIDVIIVVLFDGILALEMTEVTNFR